MLDISKELESITTLFRQERIHYALCGGMALAVHGIPRSTIDIDLMILSQDVPRAEECLSKLHYTMAGSVMSFASGNVVISRLSRRDTDSEDYLTVDLIQVTSALKSIWSGRIDVDWEGGRLTVVSREGLIFLKKLRNSGQDRDDIEKLTQQ